MSTAPEPRASASPALADGIATQVTAIYGQAETAILLTIATSARAALNAADPIAAMYARSAPVQAAVRRVLDHTEARVRAAVPHAVAEAYRRGHGQEARTVGGTVRALLDRLAQLRHGVTRWAMMLWNRLTGAARSRATASAILGQAAGRGITGYTDPRGRTWALTSYVDQTVQHAAGNAAMDGYLDRLTEHGDDLVIVTRSPHPCPICRPWEARVLSVSGTDPQRSSVAEARAAGLWHPNCHHTVYRWTPGFTWPANAIQHRPGTYEATQRQRAIERHIREWKRRQVAALDDATRAQAGRKVRQWQAALRQHIAAEGLRRSRQRERIDYGHTSPRRHAYGG